MAAFPALLFNHKPQAVLVAVYTKAFDDLVFTRCRTLVPKFVSRAAEIVGLTGFNGFLDRLGVHPGLHQGFASAGACGEYWDKAALIEFGREGQTGFNSLAV